MIGTHADIMLIDAYLKEKYHGQILFDAQTAYKGEGDTMMVMTAT